MCEFSRALKAQNQMSQSIFKFIVLASCVSILTAAEIPPKEWIEPATGHRVIRLSGDGGGSSLYFHQNAYTGEGDKMIMSTPEGISTVNLKTREIDLVVPKGKYGLGGSSGMEVGRKSRQVYYSSRVDDKTVIYATHLDTKVTKEIGKLPFVASFGGVNADETLLVGSYSLRTNRQGAATTAGDATARPAEGGTQNANQNAPRRSKGFTYTGPRSMSMFSISTANGEVKTWHPSTNWLNHVQSSPTDPALTMFCHEGEWHNQDRVWTIRNGSDEPKLMHKRMMQYEIAGHEFFSRDGKWVWYDLQTPRSKEFWLAGVNVDTGERIRYPLARSEWSVHYNVSWDGKLFAGDGGGPDSVANRTPLPERKPLNPPGNGQWVYLFKPTGQFETITVDNEKVKVGKFEAEKLVDLSKHNYRLEPNVTFSPDGKWIIFRSNMYGPTHTFAVELAKAK